MQIYHLDILNRIFIVYEAKQHRRLKHARRNPDPRRTHNVSRLMVHEKNGRRATVATRISSPGACGRSRATVMSSRIGISRVASSPRVWKYKYLYTDSGVIFGIGVRDDRCNLIED